MTPSKVNYSLFSQGNGKLLSAKGSGDEQSSKVFPRQVRFCLSFENSEETVASWLRFGEAEPARVHLLVVCNEHSQKKGVGG